MKHLGLIGYPLSHSFSVKYFREKFSREGIPEFEYMNYPIQSVQELRPLIKEKEDLIGLNVTIPHKEAVMPLLDSGNHCFPCWGQVIRMPWSWVREVPQKQLPMSWDSWG